VDDVIKGNAFFKKGVRTVVVSGSVREDALQAAVRPFAICWACERSS